MRTSSAARPLVSAVICTRNRPDKIGTAVRSVLDNDYPSFELIVIDQSTTDATAEAIRPIVAGDDRVNYVHCNEAGLSRAYNAAIGRTKGEIIAFTDDDCIVPPSWIGAIVKSFDEDGEADLLYGRVVPASTDQPELTPLINFGARPERLSRKDGFRVTGMGANFAARRRLFTGIGGFDEMLGGGGPLCSSQDYDLAYRAYRAGSVIILRPEVLLAHDGRRELEDWPALLRNYGIGDGAFYAKHVRCGDPYALWLLVRRVSRQSARTVYKRVLHKGGRGETTYLRGFAQGVRDGFKFAVDPRARLYVERTRRAAA
jgi:glycosyltransferase involved in cell wall biosynthesis